MRHRGCCDLRERIGDRPAGHFQSLILGVCEHDYLGSCSPQKRLQGASGDWHKVGTLCRRERVRTVAQRRRDRPGRRRGKPRRIWICNHDEQTTPRLGRYARSGVGRQLRPRAGYLAPRAGVDGVLAQAGRARPRTYDCEGAVEHRQTKIRAAWDGTLGSLRTGGLKINGIDIHTSTLTTDLPALRACGKSAQFWHTWRKVDAFAPVISGESRGSA